MLVWLSENSVTIIVAVVLAILAAAAIFKIFRDKKKGKNSCSCGCENCAMRGRCHGEKDTK